MNYSDCIKVANVRDYKQEVGWTDIYVGRPSTLRNPYAMRKNRNDKKERALVIAKFTEYLKDCLEEESNAVTNQIRYIGKQIEQGKKYVLLCFCSPKDCHADVIREAVLEYLESDNI